jgi:hypothetical protein
MARSLDDDAPSRISAAKRKLTNEEQEAFAQAVARVRELGSDVKRWERHLARRRSVTRVRRTALLAATSAFLTGLCWTVLTWGSPSTFIKADIICGALIVISAAACALVRPHRGSLSAAKLQENLDTNREILHSLRALVHPTLIERRDLYREGVADIIEQYQVESRKYRRVHNSLQSLIMAGSAGMTTVAALDTGKELTWQNVTIVAIGSAVTLAAAFTGYYKYRERSYFLQQTADAIEEETNALALGVGEYREFGPDQEDEALALFTQRVEAQRNEQRRRQQQLDQPTEQATPASQSVA